MKNTNKIVIAIIAIIVVIAVIVILVNLRLGQANVTKLGEIDTAEDLEKIIEKMYEGKEEELPKLQTQKIDIIDDTLVKSFTGLENGKDLEFLVVSEPLMTSQAYSLVLAKVKNGVNANKIAETMKDNIDTRKWICVSAEKVYATNSENIVCLVMSNEEWAKPVYEKFKELAGKVGQEHTKSEEEIELPPEMY